MGNGSLVDEAMVDQWCDFASQKLELPACVWWYPVAGYGCLKPESIHVFDKLKTDIFIFVVNCILFRL